MLLIHFTLLFSTISFVLSLEQSLITKISANGANIDRYASPAYITTIIGIIIYLYYFINKRNIEVKRSDKNEKHKQRRNKR